MKLDVRWEKGGDAQVVSLDGDAVVFRSTVSAPPGSRLVGTLPPDARSLRVKVHSSRLQADGTFAIGGRLIDATRELRQILSEIVRQPPEG